MLTSSPVAPLPLPPPFTGLALPAALLAATVPTVLAYNQPPSATLLNQCLAVALWGGVAIALPAGRWVRSAWPLLAALALLAYAALASWLFGALPMSLALLALGLLAGAGLMVVTGASAAQAGGGVAAPSGPSAFAALAAGLLAAGVLGAAVALVQVFAPGATDGQWIAHSGLAGRAVGNLRQPNHLGSLLLWALVAAVALHELRRLPRAALWALAALLVWAVELTASRTGAVGLGLLLLWALVDRRLSPGARWLLAATPLLYAVAYGAMAWYGDISQQALGAGARLLAEGAVAGATTGIDSPNSRLNIWRNTLALIAAYPMGVGFGEFNFAWTLTAFAHRPTAFFDHTHNLLLHLAVELGLPGAAAVCGLLGLALWQGGQRARRASGDGGVVARAGGVLVLITLLHSLVEYPLWYAYFLLPTALAWGFVLGTPVGANTRANTNTAANADATPNATAATSDPAGLPPARPARPGWGMAAGALMALGGALAVLDYQRVVVIYAPTAQSGPLAERIIAGQHSPLFAHHADYAAATSNAPADSVALGLARAPHSLLDTRLMMGWASHLAVSGRPAQLDQARWLAQRLREFDNRDADAFFARCAGAATAAFQCQPPLAVHTWREFLDEPAEAPGSVLPPPSPPPSAGRLLPQSGPAVAPSGPLSVTPSASQ